MQNKAAPVHCYDVTGSPGKQKTRAIVYSLYIHILVAGQQSNLDECLIPAQKTETFLDTVHCNYPQLIPDIIQGQVEPSTAWFLQCEVWLVKSSFISLSVLFK